MAYLQAIKTWSNEILYPSDLNAEFANGYHGFDGSLSNDINCAGTFTGDRVMMGFDLPFTAAISTNIDEHLVPYNMTITAVKIHADQPPMGDAIICDVNKNGTTIFTTQGNRPTIAAAGQAGTSGLPDVTALSAGDRLSWDIDNIGSSFSGGWHLTLTIYGKTS